MLSQRKAMRKTQKDKKMRRLLNLTNPKRAKVAGKMKKKKMTRKKMENGEVKMRKMGKKD